MKKIIAIILICLFLPLPLKAKAISAESACVIEMNSGTVLFSKNSDIVLPMASTTKIMTALTVLKSGINLNDVVKITPQMVGIEGSSMYLKEGEELSIYSLLCGLLLVSGNDAAEALAISVGGSKEKFVSKMNENAKDLGLLYTSFKNPSGLPEKEHYTTAKELSLIAAEALGYKTFSDIVSSQNIKTAGRVLVNHNKLLKLLDECIGVKTGFTKESGRCLVSAADYDGATVICVTLNASDDWNDHLYLLKDAKNRVGRQKIIDVKERTYDVNVISGKCGTATVSNANEVYVTTVDGKCDYEERIFLPEFVYAPIYEGQSVGKIEILQNGKVTAISHLVANSCIEAVEEEKFWDRFKRIFLRVLYAVC